MLQVLNDLIANGNLFQPKLNLLLRLDKDLSSTEEYMLGTVYLKTLETIA